MKIIYHHCFYGKKGSKGFEVMEILESHFHDAFLRGQVAKHFKYSLPILRGSTVCVMVDEETDREIARGYSFCSIQDQFSRRTGRTIALSRAIHQQLLKLHGLDNDRPARDPGHSADS